MTSNCYIIFDKAISNKCVIIDPGSRDSLNEIAFCEENHLYPEYIILSHEHTDHNWGVNALREYFTSVKLVCSEFCEKNIASANKAYFLFYFDDTDYTYKILPADILVKNSYDKLKWNNLFIRFILTPGHSFGSMCIQIDENIFTGDTIMPYPPYFNGRDSNKDDWESSIDQIKILFKNDAYIYPGHGETLTLGKWVNNFYIPVN